MQNDDNPNSERISVNLGRWALGGPKAGTLRLQ